MRKLAFTLAEVFSPNCALGGKIAFTLAEILVTLGIIGVVAALVFPSLISKYNERILIEQLKQTYSIFSQAYMLAVKDNGVIEDWDIGMSDTKEGSQKLYDKFKPYLKKVKDCNLDAGCFYNGVYKNLSGGEFSWQPYDYVYYSKGVLANGVPFIFWSAGSGCSTNRSVSGNGIYSRWCGSIYVDVNGNKGPNQAGRDYHKFAITTRGVYPVGLQDYIDRNKYCEFGGNNPANGDSCTAWALGRGKMDYLRRDISNEY